MVAGTVQPLFGSSLKGILVGAGCARGRQIGWRLLSLRSE